MKSKMQSGAVQKLFGSAVSLLLFLCVSVCLGQAQSSTDALENGFLIPPDSAKPRVWWHWMNGNITKEGIKLDLEWMHRVGIAGFQNFDVAMMTPPVVEKRLVFMTPEWKDAFHFAITQADRLGLEAAIAGSPGWSESGGPWVKPEQGMKKYVWSTTRIEGGKLFHGKIAGPPASTGPFQNAPLRDFIAALTGGNEPVKSPEFYGDVALVAYRSPEADVPISQLNPKVTSSAGNISGELLWDGDLKLPVLLPKVEAGKQSWIQFDFGKPQTIRALTLVMAEAASPFGDVESTPTGRELQASDDGANFKTVITIPGSHAPELTITVPETTARYFRVAFTTVPAVNPFGEGADLESLGLKLLPPAKEFAIAELVLHPGARVARWEEKSGFSSPADLYKYATPSVAPDLVVPKGDVIDLTAKMQSDGTLDWTPPEGSWTILRIGYSLTGTTNHPASPEGTGLEVDKLNRQHVRDYMTKYLDMYKDASGGLMGKRGLHCVINDSYEAQGGNWTDAMLDEFAKRRGYDPKPWLPVLTGVIVQSAEASDGFLWDFRKTLQELIAENHYDQITALLHERGMAHYGESQESGRAFIGDGMDAKRSNDVPMGAMWTQLPGKNDEQYGYNADIKESASVAHIYGQNLVAAESFTAAMAPWAWSPETLKPTADKELAMGLNRFVIHTSVHQPLVDKGPGIGLGPIGQWFTRNETWAEPAKAWISYLSRSSYMLQQGRFVADILYYYGEDSNITALFGRSVPNVPAGFSFDYVNPAALMNQISVKDGRLVTASGMSYRVLALDPFAQHMSVPVLRRIRDLVKDGAILVGSKPIGTPSLADNATEFQTIINQLWNTNGSEHSYGKGKVYGSTDVAGVLKSMHVFPDFDYSKPQSDTNLLFVHRTLPNGEMYWVCNRDARSESVEATFRVVGKEAELWYADTGVIKPASYRIAEGRTTVPLSLSPWDAVFVVFRKPSRASSRTLPYVKETSVATLGGAWDVSFQPDRGAPAQIKLDKLISWTDCSDEGVKYFSGTASYRQHFAASPDLFKASHLWIDLGDVKNIAEVFVNGAPIGISWKKPFRVDATKALKPGANEIEIKVTNLWVNRMIGDRQLNAAKKYTFTVPQFYKANSPLLPSGLLGPVQIVREE